MKLSVLAAFAVAALVVAPAQAATFNGITPTQLVYVLQSAGVPVSATSNSQIFRAGNVFVAVSGCSNGLCREINFFNNFGDVRPTLAAVNAWNNTKKVPEASINTDGTLHMEMWLTANGITDTAILDTFQWFDRYDGDIDFWRAYMPGNV